MPPPQRNLLRRRRGRDEQDGRPVGRSLQQLSAIAQFPSITETIGSDQVDRQRLKSSASSNYERADERHNVYSPPPESAQQSFPGNYSTDICDDGAEVSRPIYAQATEDIDLQPREPSRGRSQSRGRGIFGRRAANKSGSYGQERAADIGASNYEDNGGNEPKRRRSFSLTRNRSGSRRSRSWSLTRSRSAGCPGAGASTGETHDDRVLNQLGLPLSGDRIATSPTDEDALCNPFVEQPTAAVTSFSDKDFSFLDDDHDPVRDGPLQSSWGCVWGWGTQGQKEDGEGDKPNDNSIEVPTPSQQLNRRKAYLTHGQSSPNNETSSAPPARAVSAVTACLAGATDVLSSYEEAMVKICAGLSGRTPVSQRDGGSDGKLRYSCERGEHDLIDDPASFAARDNSACLRQGNAYGFHGKGCHLDDAISLRKSLSCRLQSFRQGRSRSRSRGPNDSRGRSRSNSRSSLGRGRSMSRSRSFGFTDRRRSRSRGNRSSSSTFDPYGDPIAPYKKGAGSDSLCKAKGDASSISIDRNGVGTNQISPRLIARSSSSDLTMRPHTLTRSPSATAVDVDSFMTFEQLAISAPRRFM